MRTGGILAALCAVVLVCGAAAPGSARADSSTTTSLTWGTGGESDVLDPVGGHIFVSGGSGTNWIAVFDLDGNLVDTITETGGPTGMAVDPATHTLYVALHDAGAIAAIDTTTLTEVARYPLPSVFPSNLAFAGGRIWFTSGIWDTAMVESIAPDGSGLSRLPLPFPLGATALAAGGPDGNLLAVGQMGFSGTDIAVMDVSQPTPTLVKYLMSGMANLEDMAFTPSGNDLLVASGYPYEIQEFHSDTLQPEDNYPTGAYPAEVAVSADGDYVAAGRSNFDNGGPDVYIFPHGDSTPIAKFTTPIGGLLFSPDGSRLFGTTSSSGHLVFQVIDDPTVPQPDTSLSSGPSTRGYSTKASFSFSSGDANAAFQCNLDGGGWQACTSPASYSGLSAGQHTFSVRAVDVVADPSPPSQTWTVLPPDTNLGQVPNNPSNSAAATFTFSSSDTSATFQCELDGAAWQPCTSPQTYTGLSAGQHTFDVESVNDGGIADLTPASYVWQILAPSTSLTGGPPATTYTTTASFTFTSGDNSATFECNLDGGGWNACTSPATYTGLGTGSHTFQVEATDGGVLDPTPASETWAIAPPDTQLTTGPSSTTRSTNASFAFASDDSDATFQCRLDAAGWSACSSPAAYSNLSSGTHTFSVRAVNDGGTVDPIGASQSWKVDLTTPPVADLSASADEVFAGSQVTLDASGSHDPLDGTIVDYQWDLGSGSFTEDTGSTPFTTATFDSVGWQPVRVRVTNEVGDSAVASVSIDVGLTPPPGPVGVSIDNGDYATNSPHVSLYVVWPAYAQDALISNDGGFGSTSGTRTLPVAHVIPWTLASAGSDRLPQFVYLRFPDSGNPLVTFSDNIVLDTTAPTVQSATMVASSLPSIPAAARSYQIKLRAREALSGIARVRFSPTRNGSTLVVLLQPQKRGYVNLSRTVTVKMAAKPKWVRVRSAAGTWSKWYPIG